MKMLKFLCKHPYVRGALMIFSTCVSLVIIGLNNDLSKSDCAAWVQAIGSIGAIGVAFFVMNRQNAVNLQISRDSHLIPIRLRLEKAMSKMESFRSSVESATETLNEGFIIPNSPEETAQILELYGLSDFEDMRNQAECLRIEVDFPRSDFAFFKMINGLRSMDSIVKRLKTKNPLSQKVCEAFSKSAVKFANESIEALERVRDSLPDPYGR